MKSFLKIIFCALFVTVFAEEIKQEDTKKQDAVELVEAEINN